MQQELSKDLQCLINTIKKELRNQFVDYQLLYSENTGTIRDIDIILIVKNAASIYETIKKVSPLLLPLIRKFHFLIACFPIKQEQFNNSTAGQSQFIQNIKVNGKQLKAQ